MKILQTVIKFVGEWISRAGRMPNEENILIIKDGRLSRQKRTYDSFWARCST